MSSTSCGKRLEPCPSFQSCLLGSKIRCKRGNFLCISVFLLPLQGIQLRHRELSMQFRGVIRPQQSDVSLSALQKT